MLDFPDLISDIVNSSKEEQKKLMAYETIEVSDSYDGPRLSFPLSVSDTNTLLSAFKQEKVSLPLDYRSN